MGLEEKEQKVLNEINDAIKAIREKSDLLEGKDATRETKQAEMKDLIERATRKIDELEVAQKRAAAFVSGRAEKAPEFKAFLDWARKGVAIPEEFKVMRISDQTTGGYLTTPEITAELLKPVVEFSPLREVATIKPTSRESVKIRKKTGSAAAAWTGETQTRVETTAPAYGLEEMPTHELYARVDVSNWDLEDSEFDLEAELRTEFSEQFGVAEGVAFITGNGVAKPEGFMTISGIGEVVSGDANLLTGDGFFKLYFAPKTAYVKNSAFIMNRATMLAACLLKESTTGNYLLRRLSDGPEWYILGGRVIEAKDMPSIAANAFPVAFGDWKRGYVIGDRIIIQILRDPYSAASSGAIRFHARKRVGGQVVMPEAIKKLKIST